MKKTNQIEKPFCLLQNYWSRVTAVLEDEKNSFTAVCKKLPEYVTDPENADSWKSVAREATDFLKNTIATHSIAYPQEFLSELQKISVHADILAGIVTKGKAVCEADQPSELLSFFSSDPTNIYLVYAMDIFDKISAFADTQIAKYGNATAQGSASEVIDAEIMATQEKITALLKALTEEAE